MLEFVLYALENTDIFLLKNSWCSRQSRSQRSPRHIAQTQATSSILCIHTYT